MGYAFISYSTKNQTKADAINELLKRNNIDTWMAPYDIPAGSKYAAVITNAIRECSCFVLLLSNDSQASEAVDSEVELAALTFKKAIIPIELENVVLNDSFFFYLHNKHITPIYKIDEESYEMKSILNSIIALAGQDGVEKTHKNKENKYTKMGIIALPGCEELAEKINNYIIKSESDLSTAKTDSYIIPSWFPRSSTGDGKCIIQEDVTDHDLFIICDLYNYSYTYYMRGFMIPMNPDVHYADLKNAINTIDGRANRITVIMPMLYDGVISSKASERKVMFDDMFYNLGVDSVITFDTYIDNEEDYAENKELKNQLPYKKLAEALTGILENSSFDKDKTFVISNGKSMDKRGKAYSELLNLDSGSIYKEYNLSTIANGKNPTVNIEISEDISKYQNIILVTDIASSENLVAFCQKIKEYGNKRIYILATFGVFSDGLDFCDRAYSNNLFDKIICTNLTYTEDELSNREWYMEVDMSKSISDIIYNLHNDIKF